MQELIFGFLTSFFLVVIAMPSLIKVAKLKHLVDEPSEERKLHSRSVPTIGGIMIFAGTIVAYSLWFPSTDPGQLGVNYDVLEALGEFKYLVASMFILFFLGLKDDIIGVSPAKKLLVHFVVAIILVYMADVRITSMYGLFGLENELPYSVSLILSAFTYIVIVNAINLIDGIDGLAGGVVLIASLTFSWWFFKTGDLPLALLAIGLAGALVGFLIFNFNPARIFMGDSGSLILGVIMFVLAVKMIEFNPKLMPHDLKNVSKPVFAMAILAYPLVDTLRVFIYRALKGRSPFSADKNHIHHKLLALGFNHKQTVFILYGFSIVMIGICTFLPKNEPNTSFMVVAGVAITIVQVTYFFKSKKVEKEDKKIQKPKLVNSKKELAQPPT